MCHISPKKYLKNNNINVLKSICTIYTRTCRSFVQFLQHVSYYNTLIILVYHTYSYRKHSTITDNWYYVLPQIDPKGISIIVLCVTNNMMQDRMEYIFIYMVIRHPSLQVHISKEYLQLEPIGLVFVFFFALILVIQFTAMLFHRFGTLSHILASTELNFCKKKSEDLTQDQLIDKVTEDIWNIFKNT